MTPEQERSAAELYRRWRGIEPPIPQGEVEHRVLEALCAGKDSDFSVVKNLHVVIKNRRAAWFFKFTPEPGSPPPGTVPISKPKEQPIKVKLGNYSEERTCNSGRTITYFVALQRTERLRDFFKNARENMPEIDERKIFRLWSRGSPNDVSFLNLNERKYLKMLVNIAYWLPAPVTGSGEGAGAGAGDAYVNDDAYVNEDDEVEASGEETEPVPVDKADDDEVSGEKTEAVDEFISRTTG